MKTVVVVGDDAATLALCKDILGNEGYQVRTARTAQEGLELTKALRPAAVLVDSRLPDASGVELARAIREFDDDIAAIVIAAHGRKEAVIECLRVGVRDFVEKPFRRDQLLRAVNEALALKAAQEDSRRLRALVPVFETCERIGSTLDLDRALDLALSAAMEHTRALGGFAVTRGTLSVWRPRFIRGLPLSAGPALARSLAALLADVIDGSGQNAVLLNVWENPWLGSLFGRGKPANRHPEDYWVLCGCIGRPTHIVGLLGLYAGPDATRLRDCGCPMLGMLCRQVAAAAAAAERHEESGLVHDEVMAAMGAAVDKRDPYMSGHSHHVARVSDLIASARARPHEERQALYHAAMVHDIGMIAVPDAILQKKSSLTPEEIGAIRRHPVTGAEIVGRAHSLRALVPAVRHHHERFDGRGYPDGLRGEDIPLMARILGVAEAYSAMVADRVYRPALSLGAALGQASVGLQQRLGRLAWASVSTARCGRGRPPRTRAAFPASRRCGGVPSGDWPRTLPR